MLAFWVALIDVFLFKACVFHIALALICISVCCLRTLPHVVFFCNVDLSAEVTPGVLPFRILDQREDRRFLALDLLCLGETIDAFSVLACTLQQLEKPLRLV